MPSCPAPPDCFVEEFDADPDIAGTGVILAFLISAWFSFLILTIEYFSVYSKDSTNGFTRLDNVLKGYTQKLTRNFKKPWKFKSIQPAVIMVSDQQLVTGTSILTVGYIQHCTMTQYHFYIVFLLGFVALEVYDLALLSVNQYVDKRPEMKLWRAVLMTVLFGMAIVNSFVVDHDEFLREDGDDYWYVGAPIQCIWDHFIGSTYYERYRLDLGASLFVLLWGYLQDIHLLYPDFFKWLGRFLRLSPLPLLLKFREWTNRKRFEYNMEADKKTRNFTGTCRRVSFGFLLSTFQCMFWLLFLPTFTIWELVRSYIINVGRIFSVLLWASLSISRIKGEVAKYDLIKGDEYKWGFGQILPLLLLILPAMQVYETYKGKDPKKQKTERDEDGDNKTPVRGPESEHLIMQASTNTNSIFDEPEQSELSTYSFRLQEVGTATSTDNPHQKRRQDTEARIGYSDDDTMVNDKDDQMDFRDVMYESRLFRFWMVFWVLALLGLITYGAVKGYAF
ncbi:hypothetical protein M426DRAFT_11877 [Hypoxylon sp. CI-4A]|nr:hypothetical protein M426DRAFT_11877 [Hypoxylon sp. CI-4A]